jgi:hypothetical protein
MTTAFVLSASSAAAADALIGARVVQNTKRKYESMIAVMQQYWSEAHGSAFTVPVQLDAILAFFGWLINTKYKDKPAAFSTVRLYKSALVWWYKEKKIVMQATVNQAIESLLNGYKRQVADLKQDGKLPVTEGKHYLTFQGYRALARALFNAASFSDMLFGWPYLVLQWNLIARTSSVSTMMMQHVGWEADSLLISVPKHKGDQEGAACFARHLYANPSDPIICPVLALAILTFTRILRHDPAASSEPDSLPNFRIFSGSNNNSRWSDVLRRILASLPESDVQMLAAAKKELGTHSVRKGAATYCNGMVTGPNPVQIYLRAGWSLGDTQNRYLFSGAGGDQLTGRVVCGLPFNESSFALLPPHFNAVGLDQIEWPAVLPLYARLPQKFKQALPYLLASILHHEQWLRTTLSAQHPLFSTYLFASGAVDALKVHVLVGCNRCPVTGLIATGIPPHLAMANELNAVIKESRLLKETLLARCAELPSQLGDMLLSKFSIHGAIPVTVENLTMIVNNAVSQMQSSLREVLPNSAASSAAPSHDLMDSASNPRFQIWAWGGKLHMVPEGWQFPSTDIKATWNLWHFGHILDRIRPLRQLKKADLAGASQVSAWSKTNGVMKAIAQVMVEMKLVESLENITKLSEIDSSDAFDRAIVELMEQVREGSTRARGRWMEMSVPTLYDHIRSKRKRKRQEEEEEEEKQQQEEGVSSSGSS